MKRWKSKVSDVVYLANDCFEHHSSNSNKHLVAIYADNDSEIKFPWCTFEFDDFIKRFDRIEE